MRISPISLSNIYSKSQTRRLENNNNNNNTTISFGEQYISKIQLGTPKQGELEIKGKKANSLFEVVNNTDLSSKKCKANAILVPTEQGYKGLRILVSEDSSITSTTPNEYVSITISPKKDDNKTIKFGCLYGSIRVDENGHTDKRMEAEYTKFFNLGMKKNIEQYYLSPLSKLIKDKYNQLTPTDGDGTRFKPVALLQGNVTKPASLIPATLNNNSMSIIQTVLTNFAKTNTMDDKVEFINVLGGKGSAFALLEGLKNGQISTDKPLILSWGDNFSDIDISRLILKHEDANLNSAFTMLANPTERKKAASLGVIEIEQDSSKPLDKRKLIDFVEKPKEDEDAAFIARSIVPELKKGNEDYVLAIVGPYIISREALNWIKEKYTQNHKFFYDSEKGYDFSSKVLASVMKAVKNGEIKDRNTGKAMTMNYGIIDKNETWSDVGARVDFVKAMQGVAQGQYANLPKEMIDSIKGNVDSNGNIYMTSEARQMAEAYAKKNNLELKNCIVYYNIA